MKYAELDPNQKRRDDINEVSLCGKIRKKSDVKKDGNLYYCHLSCRNIGTPQSDHVDICIPSKLCNDDEDEIVGKYMVFNGVYLTDQLDRKSGHNVVRIEKMEKGKTLVSENNRVHLKGTVVSEPFNGVVKKENFQADFCLFRLSVISGNYINYISCISFGKNKDDALSLSRGDRVEVVGEISTSFKNKKTTVSQIHIDKILSIEA